MVPRRGAAACRSSTEAPQPDPRSAASRRRRIALVGNPNVGKSVVFGALTGRYATVSNYPGTTVEVARATARFDPAAEVIDTPGVNALTPTAEDERVTRDILLEGVDAVVQVADAKNLERALAVTLELAEAEVPFVLALNMADEAADRGIAVDAERLARHLGLPVIETVAVTGRGLRALSRTLDAAVPSPWRVRYGEAVERALERVEPLLQGGGIGRRALALMCLAGDPTLAGRVSPAALAASNALRAELEARLRRPLRHEIVRARLREAERLARTVTRTAATEAPVASSGWGPALAAAPALAGCVALLAGDLGLVPALGRAPARALAWAAVAAVAIAAGRRAALRAALGRWASRSGSGLAVLFVVLYVLYRFVGVFAAGTAVGFLEGVVFGRWLNPFFVRAVDGGVAALAPGSAPLGLARDLIVGPYGVVTVGLTYAIAIILPIVTAFFLVFAVLEDSGYLPRLAVTVNRAFRAMGLNGKAVLPMVLGLGCDTMATLTARIMETPKERLLVTLLLALGVPCSAQLGVILGLLAGLPPWAPIVWGGVVVGTLFAVGLLAARVLPGESGELILELPPMRRPQLGNVVVKTIGRVEWYLREAVPIFLLGTLVLFVLDATGVLAALVRAAEPVVVGLLGLPARAGEAFLVGFFRRDYGSAGIHALFRQGLLGPVQAVVALVTITLFVPCVANFFVIVKERGLRTALAIAAFIFPFAFAVGGALNAALRLAGLP
jgi:ferrous iron transport protein B